MENSNVDQLFEADKSFSATSEKIGYAKAFIEFAHPEVVMLRKNSMPVIGKQALTKLFENAHSEDLNFTWKPLGGDIAQSGELGYTYGIYTIKQDTVVEKGTYVSVWKKDENGQWKYVLDSGNEGIGN
ncbi:MAG TPA: nuclear transport factor 2 family protein [Draconibacterium sp.]|nr:nuclear transport factor 2 family protein [Draconibacterium sp.]